MIVLQKLNGQTFILNADLIETIEATPDTVIKLTTEKTLVVRNNVEDVVQKSIAYKQLCHQTVPVITHDTEKEEKENSMH